MLATGCTVEILKEVLAPPSVLWPFVGMRCLCLYQKSIFLRILRVTGMMIVIAHFTPSAPISDGQSSGLGWEVSVRLTRAS